MRALGGQTIDSRERSPLGDLDLTSLARAIWAKRLWIAIPTALALAGSFVVVNLTSPTYRSEARILVESGENPYTRSEVDRTSGGDRSTVDQEAVLSQVQVVLSRDIARGVANQLELSRRPEFDPVLRGFNPVKQAFIIAGLSDDPLRMTAEERVLRSYYDKLSAYQVDKSRIIAVQFESTDPQFAAEAANTVAARFIEAQQANKRSQTRSAGQWLSGEVETLRRKVEEAEGRVESFRARANLFVGSNNTSLTAQQLAEVNSQIATARAQQSDAQTRSRMLRDSLRSGRSIEAGDVVNSEIIRRLNEQRAAVTAQLAEQSSTLGPRHPRINELRAQLTNLDSQIRSEAEKLVRVLENDSRLAGARVESLQQNLDQAKRQASQASEQEVQLRVLEREAKSYRDQLEGLLTRYRDATARDSLSAVPADARIISQAVVSNVPAFPKKLPTILITTLGTFLLAVGCVATGALMGGAATGQSQSRSDEFEPEQDYVESPGVAEAAPPVLQGVQEAAETGPASIAALAALLDPEGTQARRTLVVATAPGLVATGVTLALSRQLAHDGRRVVMVDLDAGEATLSALAGPSALGLSDFAAGTASFSAILHADPQSRAHVVPVGRTSPPNDDAVGFAVEVLAKSYEAVVMLAGQLPPEPDTFDQLTALATDAVIVADTSAADPAVVSAYERLEGAGLKPVIVMLATQGEAVAA